MTPTNLDALFDGFTDSAFRLEVLPTYAVGGAEAERIAAHREGRPRPERSVRTSPWLARIACTTARDGRTWMRLRVVDDPLTDYQHYQLESYRESQAAGEQVRLVRRDALPPDADVVDFWLFDMGTEHARAVELHYTPHGAFERFESLDHAQVAKRAIWARDLFDTAEPLNAFLAHVGV